MKETFALKSDRAEVVEYVDVRVRVVIEIVSERRGKLRDRATRGSGRTVRPAIDLKPSVDDAHVAHWPNPEFLIAPAIGVHRAKVAESQMRGGIKIGGESFTAESKAAAQARIAIPGSLRVTALKLVLSARCSMCIANLETELVTKVEVPVERDDRTGSAVRRETRLAGRNCKHTTRFDLIPLSFRNL